MKFSLFDVWGHRYDSLPSNMLRVVSPESTLHLGYQVNSFNFRNMPLNNQVLLSRYLHHRRWIWGITPHAEDDKHITNTSGTGAATGTRGRADAAPSSQQVGAAACNLNTSHRKFSGQGDCTKAGSCKLATQGNLSNTQQQQKPSTQPPDECPFLPPAFTEELAVAPPDMKTLSRVLHTLTR